MSLKKADTLQSGAYSQGSGSGTGGDARKQSVARDEHDERVEEFIGSLRKPGDTRPFTYEDWVAINEFSKRDLGQ